MTSKPETRMQNKMREALIEAFPSIYLIKIHGGPHQESGIPDLLACLYGVFFGVEVKMPGEEPTAKQLEHIDRIRKAGGYADAFDNVPDVVNFFKNTLDNLLNT